MATQFSTIDADGAPVVIQSGLSFQTFWEDDGEGRAPNVMSHPWNSLDLWGPAELTRWCITSETVPDPLPPEVPMERVLIILAQQGLMDPLNTWVAGLAEPEKTSAQILLNRAPNLVTQGDFAMQAKAALGLTDAQYASLIQAAVALSL